MNTRILPQSGDKLKFLTANKNFYPHYTNVIEFAKNNLVEGQEYTVKSVEEHSSWTEVRLSDEGLTDCPFHLSMFEWKPEDILRRKVLEIDSITEFGADGIHITTHPVIGLQRWEDKQYMVSFFPTDIKGNRLQNQSKIDKVYDLFLTEEQVEVIVKEYNRRNKNV